MDRKIAQVLLITIVVLTAFSCGEKKETSGQQKASKKFDSLLEESEKLLHPPPLPTETVRTTSQPSSTQKPSKTREAPQVLQMLPQVNVARWAGLSFQKLDHELGDLSATSPPTIRYYGICDRIVFRFANTTPGARLREIVCHRDKQYEIGEALTSLGIVVIKKRAVVQPSSIESTCANEGIARIVSTRAASNDSLTKRIVISYK